VATGVPETGFVTLVGRYWVNGAPRKRVAMALP